VALEFTGNTRFTPRVRSLRAEYPSHDYLRRLPKVYSRDESSFLHRYLSLFDGFLGELDARATARHTLVDPAATPAEALAWLAGFLGLVIDERWPVPVQRAVLAETATLFRFRGTVPGLTRFLELYTGTSIMLVEKFRLRGLGAVGEAGGPESRAILGAGFRVGGALAEENASPLTGAAEDAFETHAHRFSVIIPAVLTAEQLDVVRRILDVHRPAHTLFDLCTVEAGIRVGRGLHIGLTSVIGRSGGFTMLQAGASLLGHGSIVGRPEAGTRLEASRLGSDSRVG
jgi:phage tail-like protein